MLPIVWTSLLSTAALAYPAHLLGLPGNTLLDYCSWIERREVEVTKINIKTGTGRSVTLTGKATRDIVDGAISVVSLKLPFLGGPAQEFELCKDTGITCPIKAGETFTATHNLTVKLFPGFSEDKYKVELFIARDRKFPPEFFFCVDGPWKAGSSSSIPHDAYELEQAMIEAGRYSEMK